MYVNSFVSDVVTRIILSKVKYKGILFLVFTSFFQMVFWISESLDLLDWPSGSALYDHDLNV